MREIKINFQKEQRIIKKKMKKKLNLKNTRKIQCGCGVIFSRNNKARHCRSLKHQNWLNSCTTCS